MVLNTTTKPHIDSIEETALLMESVIFVLELYDFIDGETMLYSIKNDKINAVITGKE